MNHQMQSSYLLRPPQIPWHLWLVSHLNSTANRTTCWVEVALIQWCLLNRSSGNFDASAMPQTLLQLENWMYSCHWDLCLNTAVQKRNSTYIWCSSMSAGEKVWQEWRLPPPQRELQPRKSQGQVCQLKCATAVEWQHRENCCMDECFTLIENQ